MYLYRVTTPQGYIFDEVLYFTLKPGIYPFGRLEFIKELNKDEEDEYNKTIRILEKIIIFDIKKGWNKYRITTPKNFTFEATLPSGLEPKLYQFGKVEVIKKVSEDEQKHEIFTILALWEEHLPVENESDESDLESNYTNIGIDGIDGIDMDEDIIKKKIEKAIDLVCQLYKHNIISDAMITGSVANGTAKKESDIDIYLINPNFIDAADIPPETFIYEFLKKEEIEKFRSSIEIAKTLKDIGAEFKQIERKEEVFWYQIYNEEIFHLMTRNKINPFMEGIKISKDICFLSYHI